MPDRASLDIEMHVGRTRKKRKSENILRIVVLGDFAAGAPGRKLENGHRYPVSIDNIDALVKKLRPQINVVVARPVPIATKLPFCSLEDLHPDALYQALPEFQELGGIRQALSSPSTEQNGLERLARLIGTTPEANVQIPLDVAQSAQGETESDVVERLLGGAARPAPASTATRTVDQLIRSALGAAAIEKTTVSAEVGIREVDSLLTALMRGVLRNMAFQALESTWRGLDWLVRRVEEDQVRIEIIDASWAQLKDSLNDSANLENAFISRALCDIEVEDRPDLIVGLYTVDRNLDDLSLLSQLGAIAARAGAVFATHANIDLIGCAGPEELDVPNNWSMPDDDATEFWLEVQKHPVNQSLNLLAPRFVLRYPYGRSTDSIDAFKFEELPVEPDHQAFCWGNPALLFALSAITGECLIDDLPMPIFDNDLGQAQQPPIEAYVSDRAAALAGEKGVCLLRANRNTGAVAISSSQISIS